MMHLRPMNVVVGPKIFSGGNAPARSLITRMQYRPRAMTNQRNSTVSARYMSTFAPAPHQSGLAWSLAQLQQHDTLIAEKDSAVAQAPSPRGHAIE
eukprot:CAMPEP_0203881562 /NCGR_PEP_ID=MMETSP0359-20131031/25856_1 /ASSEMBLY_ACC=CAM_ASM_000338 /TAXON_ID=268821 /ORGANISM="Scrippsiella Hangoei, Strain SHTV-5" /LENGTH=95 /DNA_ID=CAMNT_0050801413 /DNA_START=103 /DNA_END=391 /DNA_ORIENTATION=+